MALELRGSILFQLPVRYTANPANAFEPFISEPAGGATIPGIVDDKGLIAVGGNFGLIADFMNGFNTMQNTFSRRPQLNFIYQSEKFDFFAVVAFGWFFGFFIFYHA